MRAFLLLTLAIALSMFVIPVAWRLAPRLGMLDVPDPRKVHRAPIPRVGGWGIVVGCLLTMILLQNMDPLHASFVCGGLILFLFGLWDDAREIGHWPKFLGQFLAVGIVVYYGNLYVTRLPFLEGVSLSPDWGRPLTMVAMVGVINALNHSDGLDGLAGGESILSLIAIAFLGHESANALMLELPLMIIGGTVGFLRFNTYPARVFMGDSGSQFLGFGLAFLVVYATQVADTAASAALPLLLLGLPIADILFVFYQRIRSRMNWFRATRNHLHHRLLDLGFSHRETVVIIYSVQALLVIAAIPLQYASDLAVSLAYLVPVAALFTVLNLAERRNWRAHSGRAGPKPRITAALRGAAASPPLRLLPLLVIGIGVPGFTLFAALNARTVPQDFALLAACLAAPLLLRLVSRWPPHSEIEAMLARALLYIGTVCATYLFERSPAFTAPGSVHLTNLLFVLMAAAIAIHIRFLAPRSFGTTPTDYLIVFGVIALGFFDSVDIKTDAMVLFAAYAIVLLYGIEVLIGRLPRWREALGWPMLLTLTVIGVRGMATL